MPERVDRPTVFSAVTETPIAVANNVWTSHRDNLVEGTCLDNGLTRFRLVGDGELSLGQNYDATQAWISQALSVFRARGVSLEDDLEDFRLVYPRALLGEGYVNDSPSKSQQRREQPVFLFVYLPPSNLLKGKTSSLHHWSFQEDGHLQITPESCCDLGLPVELDYDDYSCFSRSWPTDIYRSLHQYQVARGFDPITADFARHLGYDNYNFQPFNDSDRFKEVPEGQISLFLEAPVELGGLVNTTNSCDLSENMQDQSWVADTVMEDEYTTTSGHDVSNKRRKTELRGGGTEGRNSSHQDLYHKNDPTHKAHAVMDAGLRLIRPLPTRNLSIKPNPRRCVQQGTSTSTFRPSEYSPLESGISPQCSSLPTIHPSTESSLLSNTNLPTSTAFDPPSSFPQVTERSLHVSHMAGLNSLDIKSPFNSYNVPKSACSTRGSITSTKDSPYGDPSAYSVTTTSPEYEINAEHGLGSYGDWQRDIPDYHPPPNNISHVFDLSPASTSTFAYPSHSTAQNNTYSLYSSGGVVPPPIHVASYSFYGGSSLGPQHEWNGPVLHSQQQSVISHSWAGSVGTSLYGQSEPSTFGYEESDEWGGNGEGWF
ncbi:hypothetical protein PQX77_019153 [Marasmius sp. AFHP31]|nr:hypothetical protein PQX77_019153 [Marasmius sp. AFHP31]